MANAAAAQLGTAFIERVLAHVAEDQREAVKAAMLGSPAALEEIGQGVLRHQDYSRVRDQQTAWWNENKTALERMQAAVDDPAPAAKPVVVDPLKAPVTREEFNREGRALELESVRLNAQIASIAGRHYAEFGESVDMEALVNESIEKGIPLKQLYDTSVSERRATKSKEKYDAEIAAAKEAGRQTGRQEVMAQKGEGIPYPVGSSAPATLAGLRAPDDKRAEFSTDAAVATLVAEMNKQNA